MPVKKRARSKNIKFDKPEDLDLDEVLDLARKSDLLCNSRPADRLGSTCPNCGDPIPYEGIKCPNCGYHPACP